MTGDVQSDGSSATRVDDHAARPAPGARTGRERGSPLAGVLWVIAVALVALAILVGLKLFLPGGSQAVWVQFSDLEGRVQLGYCPSLPASFQGIALSDDLQSDSSVLPVKVTGEVCGDNQFDSGVWLYLNRSSITVATTAHG